MAEIHGSGADSRFGSEAAVQDSSACVRCALNTGSQHVVFPLLGVKPLRHVGRRSTAGQSGHLAATSATSAAATSATTTSEACTTEDYTTTAAARPCQ